jgi:hypothetical protein
MPEPARLLCLCVVVGTTTGCADDWCAFETRELSMVAVVTDIAGSVRARVDYAAGQRGAGQMPWRKCDGDEVRINGRHADETEREDRVEYSITDPAESAPRTYTFTLDRRADDAPVEAGLSLPSPFQIEAPISGQSISRSADLVLQWNPPAPDNQLSVQLVEEIGGGICLTTAGAEYDFKSRNGARVPDVGTLTVDADTIASDQGDCDAALVLRRYSNGNYPSSLAPGGFVEGRVVRHVTFVSVP